MNKNEAMKAMIDGKKIVDSSKAILHYYTFENGRFMYCMNNGNKVIANMPSVNCYEIFVVKKTINQVFYITEEAAQKVKAMNEGFNLVVSNTRTSRSSVQARISWEEEE